MYSVGTALTRPDMRRWESRNGGLAGSGVEGISRVVDDSGVVGGCSRAVAGGRRLPAVGDCCHELLVIRARPRMDLAGK